MGTSNYSDEFKRDAVQQIRFGDTGSGGFSTFGGEFALALQVAQAVCRACAEVGRGGPRSRGSATEA